MDVLGWWSPYSERRIVIWNYRFSHVEIEFLIFADDISQRHRLQLLCSLPSILILRQPFSKDNSISHRYRIYHDSCCQFCIWIPISNVSHQRTLFSLRYDKQKRFRLFTKKSRSISPSQTKFTDQMKLNEVHIDDRSFLNSHFLKSVVYIKTLSSILFHRWTKKLNVYYILCSCCHFHFK